MSGRILNFNLLQCVDDIQKRGRDTKAKEALEIFKRPAYGAKKDKKEVKGNDKNKGKSTGSSQQNKKKKEKNSRI